MRRRIVIDVAWVLSVTAVLVVVTRLALPGQVDAVGYAPIVAAGLSVGALHRRPRAVLASSIVVGAAYVASGAAPGPVLVVPLVALVAVGVRGDLIAHNGPG